MAVVVVSGNGIDGVGGIVVIIKGISGCSSLNTVVVVGGGGSTDVEVAIAVIQGCGGDAILIVRSVATVNIPVTISASFILAIDVFNTEVATNVLTVYNPFVTIRDIFVAVTVGDVRTVANLVLVLAMGSLTMLKLSVVMATVAGFLYSASFAVVG